MTRTRCGRQGIRWGKDFVKIVPAALFPERVGGESSAKARKEGRNYAILILSFKAKAMTTTRSITQLKRVLAVAFLGVLGQCVVLAPQVEAKEYDIYVTNTGDDDGDGSKESPYKTIQKALEKALSASTSQRSVSIAKGVYEESFALDDALELVGAGRGATVIVGSVTVKNDARIENLTLKSAAKDAVTVVGDADFFMKNVEIRGSLKSGINALPGKSKIIVKESTIHASQGKGMYIQKGHRLEVSDSRIYDNAEEGIDIRNNVNGFIKNNAIYENGEGGMEVIVGAADMLISKNQFTKNKASGIATQFYDTAQLAGKIQILDNVIKNNGKYGLDCNTPSGGKPGPGYWSRSVELHRNKMENNKREEISPVCKIIEAVEKNEEEDNQIKETEPESSAPDATVLSAEDLEREKVVWDQAAALTMNSDEKAVVVNQLQAHMSETNRLQLFFFGRKQADLDTIRTQATQLRAQTEDLKALLGQTQNFQGEAEIKSLIEQAEERARGWEDFLHTQEKYRGLSGWFRAVLAKN